MSNSYIHIYNNLINYTRNKDLYKNLNREDIFSDRLTLFLLHFSFFLKNFKNDENKLILQEIYDFNFRQLELSIREIGYGDQTVNKKMKTYVNLLYSIINKIDAWENLSFGKKGDILKNYLDVKENSKKFIEYFDNYNKYLSNLSLNSFTKSVIDHKF